MRRLAFFVAIVLIARAGMQTIVRVLEAQS